MHKRIKNGEIKAPPDLANILKVRTSRYNFLQSVVKRAGQLRGEYLIEIKKYKEALEVAELLDAGRSSGLTNSVLISQLSALAKPEISQLFDELDRFPSFDNAEVRLYLVLANFQMPVHLKPKDMNGATIKRLKMVLMIDEATTLVEMRFYNAFRWVIDQVIEQAWILSRENRGNVDPPELALPFTAIFMGTHSKVAHFLPPKYDASARYAFDIMKIPEPFTALDWDIKVPDVPGIEQFKKYYSLRYSYLADMTWLARFGRPCWMALWGTSLKLPLMSKCEAANEIISLIKNKLHNKGGFIDILKKIANNTIQEPQSCEKEEFILTCSAIIGVLAIINLDFFAPKRAADLVASRLRWALGCDRKRDYLLTTYPSEPMVAEAAFRLLFAELPLPNQNFALRKILEVVVSQVERGDYDAGGDGELCARILCLLFFERG